MLLSGKLGEQLQWHQSQQTLTSKYSFFNTETGKTALNLIENISCLTPWCRLVPLSGLTAM